jgi:hypothetical protein
VDAGLLAELPDRGLTRRLARLACSSREFPLPSPTVEHHEYGTRVLDHDHGRRNGHPIVQPLQLHVGDETKPHRRVAHAVTNRERSHETT